MESAGSGDEFRACVYLVFPYLLYHGPLKPRKCCKIVNVTCLNPRKYRAIQKAGLVTAFCGWGSQVVSLVISGDLWSFLGFPGVPNVC